MSDPVSVQREGAVAILRLGREEKRNALDLTMRAAIASALDELQRDETVAVIIISGGDKVFAAGADLNLLVDKGAQDVAELDLGQYWAPLVRCQKPVVAAVSGVALGAGCELAMMCDLIVADRTARFGQPEIRVGIMPGAGGTQRLLRAVGKPVASLLLMTGETLGAERAAQLGLVSELVEEGPALERAYALAQVIAGMPPKALRAIKRTLALGADQPLEVALALENREFLLLFDTQDKTEGMRAFLDKRAPNYKGK
ncbi:enoyl-CoA hydratase-related protein [Pseudomonas sp. TCU-HL1]|uniref:enoyl-CoA hydratase-related protein n=1 Tax=Pseudomonas sp. TCU-HL1 TaxID=1856685 RepID=UPI00083DB3AD|nr:enoyl-CoA hydratase-related protein [Pseudomonas sp. TCU-HL1]AOE86785.1 enoyl-CoA hydratase [Pseudomonas sp. TCU-HL1]